MIHKIRVDDLALAVLHANAVEIRDVDGGEEPFLYSSGNWGPGYVDMKNLVGRKELMRILCEQLALRIAAAAPHVQVVAGNVTGGMISGWITSGALGTLLKKQIPFVYVRDAQKKCGHKERITGIANNPEVAPGANVLVVEESVNFSQTTCNSASALREAGFTVTYAACLLSYENPAAMHSLREHNLNLISLITLDALLNTAEMHQWFPQKSIAAYREFLRNPAEWQRARGLVPVLEEDTK